MRDWTVAINTLYRTASVVYEEFPRYIWAIEKANFFWDSMAMKLPGSFWEWYWLHIFDPIFKWCNSHKRTWFLDIDYEEAKKRHPDIVEHLEQVSAKHSKNI